MSIRPLLSELPISRCLLALVLTLALPATGSAQSGGFDGPWDLRLTCSANVANGRQGFEWKARVTVLDGQFAHRMGANDRNPYDESWTGQFGTKGSTSSVRLGARGTRSNGDRWEFRFAPGSVQQNEVELSGGVYGRDKGEEIQLRTCTAQLKRAEATVASGAAVQPPSAPASVGVPVPSAVGSGQPVPPAPSVAAAQAKAVMGDAVRSLAADAAKAAGPTRAAAPAATAAPVVDAPSPRAASTPVVPRMASSSTPTAPVVAPVAAQNPAANVHASAAPSVATADVPAAKPAAGQSATSARSRPRAPGDLQRALYEDPGFDLALVVQLPGSGNLKRTLDGKWTVGSGTVSVGTMGVLASDQHYDLKGFADIAPAERGTTVYAGPFYKASLYHPNPIPGTQGRGGFSGPTPVVAVGVSANPALRAGATPAVDMKPEDALKAALSEAVGQALSRAIGNSVGLALVYQTSANVVLVPRHRVDPAYSPARVQGQWITRIEAGEAVVIGYVTQEQLRQGLKTHLGSTAAVGKQEADLLTSLKNSPASGPDSLIGAVTVRTGVNVKPCTLKSDAELAPYLLKHEPIGAWITKGAPKWSHETPRVFETAEALFGELKSAHRCTAAFGRGPLIATLATALDRDRVGNLVYPQPQAQKVVLGLKAQALGFDDVAMLEFAESIGSREPRQVKGLKALGVTTKPLVEQARERLKKYDAQATSNLDVLMALLQDEADARKQGVSIEKLQAVRAERAAKEAKEAAAAQKENDKRLAKDYPYVAQLRCHIGEQTVSLVACMTEGGLETEVELRNGGDYRMYKAYEIQGLGTWSDTGVAINLRSAFAIKAQNASNTAVLDVVVRDRSSGSVKFQKSAARFGVVAVQN